MTPLKVLAGLVAAFLFAYAGTQMQALESQAGNTVAEFFYQAMGLFSYGMAALAVAVCIPFTPQPQAQSQSRVETAPPTPPTTPVA